MVLGQFTNSAKLKPTYLIRLVWFRLTGSHPNQPVIIRFGWQVKKKSTCPNQSKKATQLFFFFNNIFYIIEIRFVHFKIDHYLRSSNQSYLWHEWWLKITLLTLTQPANGAQFDSKCNLSPNRPDPPTPLTISRNNIIILYDMNDSWKLKVNIVV